MAKRPDKRTRAKAKAAGQEPIGDLVEDAQAADPVLAQMYHARGIQFWEQGLALDPGMSLLPDFQRQQLLKAIPASLPDLMAKFDSAKTSAQDQLILTSIDIELKAAGLGWHDLANLLRWQIVAHRKATMRGVVHAALAHPRAADRLTDWDRAFLNSLKSRNRLLTEKQAGVLQSISDSLDMKETDFQAYSAERRKFQHRVTFGDVGMQRDRDAVFPFSAQPEGGL